MRKLVDYTIVWSNSIRELRNEIVDLAGLGWELVGGVHAGDGWCQAMARYEKVQLKIRPPLRAGELLGAEEEN